MEINVVDMESIFLVDLIVTDNLSANMFSVALLISGLKYNKLLIAFLTPYSNFPYTTNGSIGQVNVVSISDKTKKNTKKH